MTTPEHRIMTLELQHAARAIERARLLSKGSEIEADLANLLEAAQELLKEIATPISGISKEDVA